MAMREQTSLLLVALLLLIAACALSVGHQVNTLSHLKQEYSDTEKEFSNLMKEWEALSLERWMLLNLGTHPRNASSLDLVEGIESYIFFYSSIVSEGNLTSRFDPLAEIFNVTIAYLDLANQTNLDTLTDICNKTGFFSEPSPWQNYVIVLNSSKIICLGLEQVDNEVFGKCVEYLGL